MFLLEVEQIGRYNNVSKLLIMLLEGCFMNARMLLMIWFGSLSCLMVHAMDTQWQSADSCAYEANARKYTVRQAVLYGYHAVKTLLLDGKDPDQGVITPMHVAASIGNYHIVRLLLKHGANPNSTDNCGLTPLHIAIRCGHLHVARFLLNNGGNPQKAGLGGWTPLHSAANKGDVCSVALLLKHDVNPNSRDKNGVTPLQIAARCGFSDVCELLLKNGADPKNADLYGFTALHEASIFGHPAIVRSLVKAKAEVNKKIFNGQSPFDFALQNNNADVGNELLLAGANDSDKGQTSLHLAVKHGYELVVNTFLERRVPDTQDKKGRTSFHFAAKHGRLKVILALLQHQQIPYYIDNKGRSILHVAARFNHYGIVNVLLGLHVDPAIKGPILFDGFLCKKISIKYPFDVNMTDNNKWTPLHWAAICGNKDMVTLLLQHKADPNVITAFNETPLSLSISDRYCCTEAHKDITELLLCHGADTNLEGSYLANLNKCDKFGHTPLFKAVAANRKGNAHWLLENKADPNIGDFNGITPLHKAAEHDNAFMVALLLKYGADPLKKDRIFNETPAARAQSVDIIAMIQKARTKRLSTFCCILHDRCGAKSMARILPKYSVEKIIDLWINSYNH